LPVGFIWGEQDGEVLFHPDEAVTGAIRTVFERFAEFGSARRVWLWFRSEGFSFPLAEWNSADDCEPCNFQYVTIKRVPHARRNQDHRGDMRKVKETPTKHKPIANTSDAGTASFGSIPLLYLMP
jgi:hypothetical protein